MPRDTLKLDSVLDRQYGVMDVTLGNLGLAVQMRLDGGDKDGRKVVYGPANAFNQWLQVWCRQADPQMTCDLCDHR